jgi:hypothetical protein
MEHTQRDGYTKRQVDTWQSFPELFPENGDLMSEKAEILNVDLGHQISGCSIFRRF